MFQDLPGCTREEKPFVAYKNFSSGDKPFSFELKKIKVDPDKPILKDIKDSWVRIGIPLMHDLSMAQQYKKDQKYILGTRSKKFTAHQGVNNVRDFFLSL